MLDTFPPLLPPERLPREEVLRQAQSLDDSAVRMVLDNLPHIIFILNSFRQIVFCNRHFLTLSQAGECDAIIGLRPGEALRCRRAPKTEGGCGTGAHCRQCGGAQALLESLAGREAVTECRLTCNGEAGIDSLDLRVHTRPLQLGGNDFILYAMHDVSDEKRRQALERLFFHDILNTATGLRGLIQFLAAEVPPTLREETILLAGYFEQMIEEILSQKQLLDAEHNRLETRYSEIDPGAFLDDLVPLYRTHPLAAERRVRLGEACFGRVLCSDPRLLKRILDNMVKNALEAETPGATVTLSCSTTEDGIRFAVHNPTPIPADVRLHLFERSYSTKGIDRGLGTYGMRLLGERCLRGSVGCVSTATSGTTFFLDLPWSPPDMIPAQTLGAAG